jgi:FkbM family methyltransferase
MSVRTTIEGLADKLGYTITPKWREPNLPLASLLRDIFAVHAIDTVIDVGANVGQYHQFLRLEVGFTGDIYSFEPQPELATILNKLAEADPRWHIQHKALGSEDTELQLNVMAESPFTSFLEPENADNPQFAGLNEIKAQHMVPVRRLDGSDVGAGQAIYLKCDTQGFDMEVIRGATGTLSRIKAMQIEMGVQRIYKGLPHYTENLKELEALGFIPAGFVPVSRDANLGGIEFDAVLVRDHRC